MPKSKCCGAEVKINIHSERGMAKLELPTCTNCKQIVRQSDITTPPTSTEVENGIVAIDPNDYTVIDRESFLSQYGKAAERFIADIEQLAELRGEQNAYRKVVELRSGYVYDEYSTLYQKSAEIRSEWFDKEGEFLEAQLTTSKEANNV